LRHAPNLASASGSDRPVAFATQPAGKGSTRRISRPEAGSLLRIVIRIAVCCIFFVAAPFAFAGVAEANDGGYLQVDMHSEVLSRFWGQPVSISAHVLLPDSYYTEPSRRYPVMYFIQGFNGYGDPHTDEMLSWQKPMREFHQEFILIFLDGMFNGGHQEFADSATYGRGGKRLRRNLFRRRNHIFAQSTRRPLAS
jgi:hypothetical protein